MPIAVDDIRFQYSGGSGNTLAANSLGGVMSTTRVTSQLGTFLNGVITGVTILAANNCIQGNGAASYNPSTGYFSFQPPGGSYVYSVVLTADGTYSVGGTDGMLMVQVVFASLPVIYKSDTVVVSNQMDKVFATVSAVMSLTGSTEYRCLYVKNIHPTLSAVGVVLYIAEQTTGPDSIFIGIDPAGVGDGSTTGVAVVTANGTTAPAGVVFSEPLSIATGIAAGTLTAGQSFAFWEKRVVSPGSTGYLDINTFKIGLALTSL